MPRASSSTAPPSERQNEHMTTVLHLVRSLISPLTRTRAFRWAGPRLLPLAERAVSWLSRGRVQVSAMLVPSLVLHTVGAKSGLPRDSALMYTPDGHGRAIVTGTSFAQERHPAWTYNLLAHPDAAITVRGRRMPVHASLIGDDERDAAWARIEAQWPGYRAYERESGRVVRLFRLQPVADAHHASM
jgi:deazaflavin-dependent oxidoreductase (nitroreductase family)